MSTNKLDDILGVTAETVEPAETSETKVADSTTHQDESDNKSVESKNKTNVEEKPVDKKPKEVTKTAAETKSQGQKSSESKEKSKKVEKEPETAEDSKQVKQDVNKDKDKQKSKQVEKVSKDDEATQNKDEANPLREYVDKQNVEPAASEYPFKVMLPNPVPTYRGPSMELQSRYVGGLIEVLGDSDKNGFTPVTYVRSEFGKVKGYIRLPKEAIRRWKH